MKDLAENNNSVATGNTLCRTLGQMPGIGSLQILCPSNYGNSFPPSDFIPPTVTAFPSGGKFGGSIPVQLLVNEAAQIYYTLNEEVPSQASVLYNVSQPILITDTTTVRFIAYDTAGNVSAEKSAVYTISAGSTTIQVSSGETFFQGEQAFHVSSLSTAKISFQTLAGQQYQIRYGQESVENASIFGQVSGTGATETVTIPGSILPGGSNNVYIISGAGIAAGWAAVEMVRSDDYALTYNLTAGGLYNQPLQVSLINYNWAKIFYTTDGSNPTIASSEYTGPINLNSDTIFKYRSVDSAGNVEPVRSVSYDFDFTFPAVTFVSTNPDPPSLSGGNGNATLDITFSVDQAGDYVVKTGSDGTLSTGLQLLSGTYPVAGSSVTVTVNESDFQEGSNTLHIFVTDAANNTGNNSLNITKDSGVKIPVLISPKYAEFRTSGNITFSWSDLSADATEIAGISGYDLQISTTPDFSSMTQHDNIAITNFTTNMPLAGRYYFRVRSHDQAGNTSAFAGARVFYLNKARNDLNGDGFSDFAVSAPAFDVAHTAVKNGKVYVYFGAASLTNIPAITLTHPSTGVEFGSGVTILQDFNGDGYSDLAIGASANGTNGFQSGAIYLFLGGAALDAKCGAYHTCALTSAQADQTYYGELIGDKFGAQVVDAADMNLDGYTDLAVSAPGKDTNGGGANSGRTYLFFGRADANLISGKVIDGTLPLEQLGLSLARGSDYNSDGYADIFAASPYRDTNISGIGYTNSGRITIITGKPNVSDISSVYLESPGNSVLLGAGLAASGDFNNDGYSDVIAGGPESDKWSTDGGDTAFFSGGATDASAGTYPSALYATTASRYIYDAAAFGYSGNSVSVLENLDGTFVPRFIICAYGMAYGGNSQAGSCFLYQWAAGTEQLLRTLGGTSINENFGSNTTTLGDINGDGNSDFAVASCRRTVAGQINAGRVSIFLGANSLPAFSTPDLLLDGEGANDCFGEGLSGK